MVLRKGALYSFTAEVGLHLSSATLDTNCKGNKCVQLWLRKGNIDHLFGCVSKTVPHIPLDLTFSSGETVGFLSEGGSDEAIVYISGYTIDKNYEAYPNQSHE